MQLFQLKKTAETQPDMDLAMQTGNVEKEPVSVQNENAAVQQPSIDPELERRVVRKTDMNLVPLVMALYLLAFLDRSNIGNARIAGMSTDLNLIGDRYDWLLTIFYIPYIIFEFPIKTIPSAGFKSIPYTATTPGPKLMRNMKANTV